MIEFMAGSSPPCCLILAWHHLGEHSRFFQKESRRMIENIMSYRGWKKLQIIENKELKIKSNLEIVIAQAHCACITSVPYLWKRQVRASICRWDVQLQISASFHTQCTVNGNETVRPASGQAIKVPEATPFLKFASECSFHYVS